MFHVSPNRLSLVGLKALEKMSAPQDETFFDARCKIWKGAESKPLFHQDASIGRVSLFVLGINPDKDIQVCNTTGQRLTCKDLAQLGSGVAYHFRNKLGLQQEDVIGIMASNTTYLAPVVLGAFLIGASINPIHHTFDKNTVKHIFGTTKPKVFFCDEVAYSSLKEGLDEIALKSQIYILQGHVDGVPKVQEILQKTTSENIFVPAELRKGGDQTAAILCSSGTTGLPKGVCISHKQLLSKSDLTFGNQDEALFSFSTLYWISGLFCLVGPLISGTLRVITDQLFSPELFLQIVEKHKVTKIVGPPSHAALLIQYPQVVRQNLSSIRAYFCGGSSVAPSLSKKVNELLGRQVLSEAYGLTEFGGLSNINMWPQHREGSVGKLVANTKAKILAENGEPLGVGEKGEIYLWSPFKWNGYYGKPEMTKLAIDNDGWLRTGDLGYFDKDGFLFVCGRKKDVMKFKNFQFSPIEIEEVIMKIPGVVEVCVFGILDEVAGDLPAAAIVKSLESDLTEEVVSTIIANCMSEAKRLHGGVFFVSELPKTPSGKIQRHKLLPVVSKILNK